MIKNDSAERAKKRLISVQELSEMIGICESTLYSWTKSKKIDGVHKFGRCIRFDYESVILWISEHEVKVDCDNDPDE